MRLIDADELKELFAETITYIARKTNKVGALEHMIRASAMVVQMIDDAPTVDAVPVKHGRWIAHTMSEITGYDPALSGDDPVCTYSCSVCGEDCYVSDTGDDILSNYCPNCGARMDEE